MPRKVLFLIVLNVVGGAIMSHLWLRRRATFSHFRGDVLRRKPGDFARRSPSLCPADFWGARKVRIWCNFCHVFPRAFFDERLRFSMTNTTCLYDNQANMHFFDEPWKYVKQFFIRFTSFFTLFMVILYIYYFKTPFLQIKIMLKWIY